jgi:hypothetical protein
VLAGCGSTPLSTSQLRTGVTRVCTVAGRETNAIARPRSPAAGAAFLKRGLAVLRPELAQLQAFRPPSDLAQVYRISLDAFSGKLGALTRTVRALDRGADPVPAFQALQRRLAALEAAENGGWQALEIPACLNQ